MNGTIQLPSIDELKAQAKRLRVRLGEDGHEIGHSKALELIAQQYGYRDWNTLHAAVGNRERPPVTLGARVAGRYLGQSFAGEVIAVADLQGSGRYRVTLQFDEPVDVVTFDSFSAFRRRVTCTIGRDGRTAEKTSNGLPQLELQHRG